jgi:hypothetical protein
VVRGNPPRERTTATFARPSAFIRLRAHAKGPPNDDLEIAEKLMATHHKSRIACLDDDGQLAGIISLSDILERDQSKRAARTARTVAQRETTPLRIRPDGALR